MNKYSVGDVVKVAIECKAIVKEVKYTPICYPGPTRLEIKDNYSYKCKIKNAAIDETQFSDWNDVEVIDLWDKHYDKEKPKENTTEKIEELDVLGIGESQNIDNLGLANSIVDLRNEIREIQHKLNEVIRELKRRKENERI